MALAAAAVVVLAVASVCPSSLAYPAGSFGASSFFRMYTIALGETVTIQSPSLPTTFPPSAYYGWNVLCAPSESTALLISCAVDLEDTPLCYLSSLIIKTDDGNRTICGKEYVADFVSSRGFVRFEYASKSKAVDQGFKCEAKCQAPEEVVIVSPPTLEAEANAATGTLEGEEEGSLELETVTDDVTADLETVTDAVTADLETVTDGAEDQEILTDDAEGLGTVTDGAEDQEILIDDAEDLETVTDGAEDQEILTDDAEDLETVTNLNEDLEVETDDGAEDLATDTDGAEHLETVTDKTINLETMTGFAEDLETETDGAQDLESESVVAGDLQWLPVAA